MKVRLPLSLLFACAVPAVSVFAAEATSSASIIDPAKPTSVFDDKYLSKQWQWYTSKNGVNIVPVWRQGITGSGVVIGIIDEWIEPNFEDLNVSPYNTSDNAYDGSGLSKDFVGTEVIPTDDPDTEEDESETQIYTDENHGQFVAGMAAAIGGNGVGVAGAAPGATIAGLHVDLTLSTILQAAYWASGVSVNSSTGAVSYSNEAAIQVKNCSFGSNFNQVGEKEFWDAIAATSANNVIYVFSAGNSRGEDSYSRPGSTGWSSEGSCPDIINVGATNDDGRYTSFSCFGSNLFVSAPGEAVVSTDRSADLGYNAGGLSSSDSDSDSDSGTSISNGNYASSDGTSFSSPLVAGVIALGKEICAPMDARWAKYAIAYSSGGGESPNIDYIWDSTSKTYVQASGYSEKTTDSETGESVTTNRIVTGDWAYNTASGLWFNNNYGFGMIDPEGFVEKVRNIAYTTVETAYTATSSAGIVGSAATKSSNDVWGADFSVAVAGAGEGGTVKSFLTQNVETVSVTVKFSEEAIASEDFDLCSLKVILTDSNGYESVLVQRGSEDPEITVADVEISEYTFLSNAFWGGAYTGTGDWTVRVEYDGLISGGTSVDMSDWVTVSTVNFTMGKQVNEGTLNVSSNVNAHALVLDSQSFTVRANGSFLVEDAIYVNGGTFLVADGGTVGAYDEATLNKGAIFVQNGGTATIRGTASFARGLYVNGGQFNLYSTVTAGAGTFVNGGTFLVKSNIDGAGVSAGAVTVGGGSLVLESGSNFTSAVTVNSGSFIAGTGSKGSTISVLGGNASFSDKSSFSSISAGRNEVTETKEDESTGEIVTEVSAEQRGGTVAFSGKVSVKGGVSFSGNAVGLVNSGGTVSASTVSVSGDSVLTLDQKTAISAALKISERGTVIWTGSTAATGIEVSGGTLFASGETTLTAKEGVSVGKDGAFKVGKTTLDGILSVSAGATLEFESRSRTDSDLLTVNDADSFVLASPDEDSGVTTLKYRFGNAIPYEAEVVRLKDGDAFSEDTSDAAKFVKVELGEGTPKVLTAMEDGTFRQDDLVFSLKEVVSGTSASLVLSTDQEFDNLHLFYSSQTELQSAVQAALLRNIESIGAFLGEFNAVEDTSVLLTTYEKIGVPSNVVAIDELHDKQANAITGAVTRRSRELRSGFIHYDVWSNPLLGNSGFSFSARPNMVAAKGFVPYMLEEANYPLMIWANGGYSFSEADDGAMSVTSTKSNMLNVALGADYGINENLAAGVFIGYTSGRTKFDDGGRTEIQSRNIGVYLTGSKTDDLGSYYGTALAAVGFEEYDFSRKFSLGSLNSSATASPDGWQGIFFLEGGYEWKMEKFSMGPSVSVRYVSNNIDGYTESSADAWLSQEVDDVSYDSLQTSLGWRFAYRADFETVSILPEARISWNHEFLGTDEDFDAKLALPNADSYTCTIADTGDDYMSVGVGLTMMLGEVSTVSLDYDVQFMRDDADPVHSINAMFRTRF